MAIAPLKGRAELDSSQALTSIGKLITGAGSLKTALLSAGSAFLAFASSRSIFNALKSSVEAFKVQEAAINRMEAALSTAGAAGVEALDPIIQRAGELQRITTKADEAIIAATADLRLLATGLDANDLIKAQEALIGIADTFLQGNLTNAASLVGKTIGSTTNALTRYGITIDTSASQSEKLRQILEQTAGMFAVSTEAVFTLKGAQEQLDNATGDLKEEIGGIVVDVFQLREANVGLTGSVFDLIDALREERREFVQVGREIVSVVALVVRAIVNLLDAAGESTEALNQLLISQGAQIRQNLLRLIPGAGELAAAAGDEAVEAWERWIVLTNEIAKDLQDIVDAAEDVGKAFTELPDPGEGFRVDLAGRTREELQELRDALAETIRSGLERGVDSAAFENVRRLIRQLDRRINQPLPTPDPPEPIDTSGLAELGRVMPLLTEEALRTQDAVLQIAVAYGGPVAGALIDALEDTENWRERIQEIAAIVGGPLEAAIKAVTAETRLNLDPVTETRDVVGDLVDQWDEAARAAEQHRREVLQTVRAVEAVARGFVDVLQATGAIGRDLGSILGSTVNLGSNIASISAATSLTAALPFVGGALGAGANILSGLLGESEDDRRLREGRERLRAAVIRSAEATEDMARAFEGFQGSAVEGLLRLAEEGFSTRFPGGVSIFPGSAEFLQSEFGLTLRDLEKAARSAGLPIQELIDFLTGVSLSEAGAQLAADQFDALIEKIPEIADALLGFNDQLRRLSIEFGLFDIDTPIEQIPRLVEKLLEFTDLPEEFRAALTGVDLTTAEGRAAFEKALQDLFVLAQDPAFLGRLDEVSRGDFLAFLGRLETLTDRIAEGGDVAGDGVGGFRVENTITRAQAGQGNAFLSTIAIILSQSLLVQQEQLRVMGGTVPEQTIDLGPAFAPDPTVFDEQLVVLTNISQQLTVLTDIKQILQAGSQAIAGPSSQVNVHVLDRELGTLERRAGFFTGAPRQVRTR